MNVSLHYILTLIAIAFCTLFPSFVMAQDEDIDLSIFDMLEMKLEDLMEVNVLSVVDADDNLRTATIFRFDEKEIINGGYYNLEDILDDIPGMSTIDNGFFRTGEQRGIAGNFDKLLLLINGREMRSLSNAQAFISHQFATHNISRIEITQGPQGVQYGANAYSGVVNVITKNASKNYETMEVAVEAGSQGRKAVSLVMAKKVGQVYVNVNARAYHTTGRDFTDFVQDTTLFSEGFPNFANGMNTTNVTYANSGLGIPISVNAKYKSFYGGVDYYLNHSGNKGLQYVNLQNDNHNTDQRNFGLYYLGWQHRFQGKHLLHLEYQYYQEKIKGELYRYDINTTYFEELFGDGGRTIPLDETEINNHFALDYSDHSLNGSKRHRFYTYFNTFLDKHFCIHTGYNFEYSDLVNTTDVYNFPLPNNFWTTDGNPSRLPFFQYTTHTAFLQLEKAFLEDKFFVIVGGRATHNSNYGFLTNFKAGMIYQPLKQTYLKAFFNQGYREPTILELTPTDGSTTAKSLKPSVIHNTEVNIMHRLNKAVEADVSLYHGIISNNIIKDETTNEWKNEANNTSVSGLEVQFRYRIKRASARLSYAYTHASNGTNLYPQRASLAFTYRITPTIQVNTRLNYYPAIETTHGNPFITTPIALPSKTRLNFTLSTKELRFKKLGMQFMGTVNDVLGTNFYQPNVLQTGPRQLLQIGRQLHTKVIFKYY